MYIIFKFFLLFIIYSFMGWLMEVIVVSIAKHKLSSRGFLIGPVCPIYGVSVVAMTLLLTRYGDDYFTLFCMSFLICTVIEYSTSIIMEKLFKTRWWDYTQKRFNLNGRVCLQNSILFGILGVLVIKFLNPFIMSFIDKLPNVIFNSLSITILIILLVDISLSFNVMCKIRGVVSNVRKDCTDEITKNVREFIQSRSPIYKRILKAFPNLKSTIKFKK